MEGRKEEEERAGESEDLGRHVWILVYVGRHGCIEK